jgi:hypothetical protein
VLRRLGKWLLGLFLVIALGLFVVGLALHRPLPEGVPGLEADALAQRMMSSVNAEAWARVGAIRFDFAQYDAWLWDRKGQRARLKTGDLEVQFHTDTRDGLAFKAGRRLEGEDLDDALASAWARFCNDTFWLNPVVKAFDMGTERMRVELDGGRVGLLVRYAGGGVTPGDSYLWMLDEAARPTAWRMWVKVLPVGGLEVPWAGWTQLPGGAWISTEHPFFGPVSLKLTNIAVADDVEQLEPGAFAD